MRALVLILVPLGLTLLGCAASPVQRKAEQAREKAAQRLAAYLAAPDTIARAELVLHRRDGTVRREIRWSTLALRLQGVDGPGISDSEQPESVWDREDVRDLLAQSLRILENAGWFGAESTSSDPTAMQRGELVVQLHLGGDEGDVLLRGQLPPDGPGRRDAFHRVVALVRAARR